MVNAYLGVVKVDIFGGCYALFVGMGNLAICDGWFLEVGDLKLFDIPEDYAKDALLGDGVLLFKSPKSLEKIMEMIKKKYPHGFCLACLRNEYRWKESLSVHL